MTRNTDTDAANSPYQFKTGEKGGARDQEMVEVQAQESRNGWEDRAETDDQTTAVARRDVDDEATAGDEKIVCGSEGDQNWGGEWFADGDADTFIMSTGSSKDMIQDFETDKDVVDLSTYGLEFSDLAKMMSDQGWATKIDLSGLAGGQVGNKLILKSIDSRGLDESNFIF